MGLEAEASSMARAIMTTANPTSYRRLPQICLASSGCILVTEPKWCSGITTEARCRKSHTETLPCVWVARNGVCKKAPLVPTVTLNTGAKMPMLAFGTGMIPLNSVEGRGKAAKRRLLQSRSALPLVNMSLSLGFTHIDTADTYPDFAALGAVLRPHRHRLFVTSKVDPTVCPCGVGGASCFASVLNAANASRRRLGGLVPDLLLLHRPPKQLEGHGNDDTCKRLREAWRGLEAAHRRGLAKAIGLSNVCGGLLTCLAARVSIKPAVLQYMHHVGMGDDPYGYASYAKRMWKAHYMAYSVLGGAEQDFERITSSPAVVSAASAHRTHPANIAVSWVAQRRTPFVVISSKASHLRDNLHAVAGSSGAQGGGAGPPWGRLSAAEMKALTRASEPAGRPSHWADCRDERIAVRTDEL